MQRLRFGELKGGTRPGNADVLVLVLEQISGMLKPCGTHFPFWNKKRKFLHVTGCVKEMLYLRDSDVSFPFCHFPKSYGSEPCAYAPCLTFLVSHRQSLALFLLVSTKPVVFPAVFPFEVRCFSAQMFDSSCRTISLYL